VTRRRERQRARRLALAHRLIAVVLLLVPAACGSETTTTGGTTAAASVAETGRDLRPAGTLRIADFSDVTTFDPALAQITQAAYLFPVYDTLLRQDPAGNLIAGLATAWTEVGQRTFRFTLRDDVVFHDGAKLDASVVKLNLDRARAALANPNAATFADMTEIVLVDRNTIEVHFSDPSPTFLIDMSLIPGMMVSPSAINDRVDLTRDPHGSGGWIWNRSASTDGVRQSYDLNPRYWAPDLQGVERLEINVITDNHARLNALKDGQVDIVNAALPTDVQEAADQGFAVLRKDVDVHFLLIPDRAGQLAAPLADRRVRQAIGRAIDREGYLKTVLNGVGTASGGLVPPALTDWYDQSLTDVPSYDPDLARKLLADAGYRDGFELSMPTLPLLQTSNEAVAQMLRAVGVRVTLVPLQNGQLGPEVRKGRFPATVAAATEYHPDQLFSLFLSGSGPYNPFHVADTGRIDTLLRTAAGSDVPTAKQLYSDVARLAIKNGIMFPIAFTPVINLVAPKVRSAFIPLGARSAGPYGIRLKR
jgi:peptide/nickel transport system substrate-binding protein